MVKLWGRAQVAAVVAVLAMGAVVLPSAAAESPSRIVSDPSALSMIIGSVSRIGYKVVDDDGCPYSPFNAMTLDILGSAGLGVFPYSLTFTSCDTMQYVNITATSLGTLTLALSASDRAGTYIDPTSAIIDVVVHVPDDPYPPVITTAPDQWYEAVGPAGARGIVWASAVDPVQGSISGARCTPEGPWFPINGTGPGRTRVSCTVSDASGNIDTGGFWIQVNDSTPPTLPPLSDQEVIAAADGAVLYSTPPAADIVDIQVPLTCAPASGSRLAAGAHHVSCSATDLHGNVATGGFFVLVVHDLTAPTIFATDRHAVTSDPAGRVVAYAITTFDGSGGPVTLDCTPDDGSLFPVGTTRVTCSATDASGNTAMSAFDVVVDLIDVVAPVLLLPDDITLEATGPVGAKLDLDVSAVDGIDGAVAVDCQPASGTTFPLGTTVVTCRATDGAANIVTGTFDVIVQDTTPPQLLLPEVLGRFNEGPVTWSASATDIVDASPAVTCSPMSGWDFPVGTTLVTCTATDFAGNQAIQTFPVVVTPAAPPRIAPHADEARIANATQGTLVNYTPPSATDHKGSPLDVTCAPGEGDFPLGNTLVTCSATDDLGQTTTTSFVVSVSLPPPPAIDHAPDMILEATGPAGAIASYTMPVARDGAGLPLSVTCAPASGDTIPLGTTTVSCTASDSLGRLVTTGFLITVRDTTPPTMDVLPSLNVTSVGPIVVSWNASALDLVSGVRNVTCTPASGSVFPLGTTVVTCNATDVAANQATSTILVTVAAPPPCDIDGWTPPVDTPGHTKAGINSFKLGSSIPLKIREGCNGGLFSAAPRLFFARRQADGSLGQESPGSSKSDDLNGFDHQGNHWQYNWDTRGLRAGTYQLRIDVGDGASHTKLISLR